jgi:hypothetical protein
VIRVKRYNIATHIQVFQHGKPAVQSMDGRTQIRIRLMKVYASHPVTMLEGKEYSFKFIARGEIMTIVIMVNDERKRRGMCQHVRYGRAMCTDEAETKVGCGTEYEVSPSSANFHGLIPPAFFAPNARLSTIMFIFSKDIRSAEIKYVEKGIIVKVVNRYIWLFANTVQRLLVSQ